MVTEDQPYPEINILKAERASQVKLGLPLPSLLYFIRYFYRLINYVRARTLAVLGLGYTIHSMVDMSPVGLLVNQF